MTATEADVDARALTAGFEPLKGRRNVTLLLLLLDLMRGVRRFAYYKVAERSEERAVLLFCLLAISTHERIEVDETISTEREEFPGFEEAALEHLRGLRELGVVKVLYTCEIICRDEHLFLERFEADPRNRAAIRDTPTTKGQLFLCSAVLAAEDLCNDLLNFRPDCLALIAKESDARRPRALRRYYNRTLGATFGKYLNGGVSISRLHARCLLHANAPNGQNIP